MREFPPSGKKVGEWRGRGYRPLHCPLELQNLGGLEGLDLEVGRGCWLLASCVTWV